MKKIASILTVVGLVSAMALSASAAEVTTTFTQVISAGDLSVDIVDGNGDTVESPSVAFTALTTDFSEQTSTGTLGTSSEKIRVSNATGNAVWTLSMAANGGASDVWTDGSNNLDFNDPDGAQLSVDTSSLTVAETNANFAMTETTNYSKGGGGFSQGVTDSIDILVTTSDASTPGVGQWDLEGVGLSQSVPAGTAPANYEITMKLTAI